VRECDAILGLEAEIRARDAWRKDQASREREGAKRSE
jgi:hypothetical protein